MSKNLNIDLSPTRHLLLKDGGDEIEDVDWNAIIGSGAQSWPISISKVVKRKLSSYRSQDIRKSRWDEENAITADGVWDMMKERGGCC